MGVVSGGQWWPVSHMINFIHEVSTVHCRDKVVSSLVIIRGSVCLCSLTLMLLVLLHSLHPMPAQIDLGP